MFKELKTNSLRLFAHAEPSSCEQNLQSKVSSQS